LLLLAIFGWQAESEAVIGTVDAVPAATLLLPYFEVELDNPNGQTTLFSINNSTATAVLAHVVLWTDLVSRFCLRCLPDGYDVQTVNLRDIFNGTVPRTASDGQDLYDTANPLDGLAIREYFLKTSILRAATVFCRRRLYRRISSRI